MTESTTRKPWLTRRRVIAGAVLLVPVLAVAVILGAFEGDSRPPVKLSFMRFEKQFGQPGLAVVTVSNLSDKTDQWIFLGSLDPEENQLYPGFPTNHLYWVPDASRGSVTFQKVGMVSLKPSQTLLGLVTLSGDGRVGRVAVRCLDPPRPLAAVLEKVRQLMWKVKPRNVKIRWAVLDQQIQCPLTRPDGTVEPPRLLPKDRNTP